MDTNITPHARFAALPEKHRQHDTAHISRLLWMAAQLLTTRVVYAQDYFQLTGMGFRTWNRDIRRLRDAGFILEPTNGPPHCDASGVRLITFDPLMYLYAPNPETTAA